MHPGRRRARLAGGMMFMLILVPASGGSAQDPVPPLPPPRPDRPVLPPAETPTDPEQAGEVPAEQKSSDAGRADAACIERLNQLGVRFEAKPPVVEDKCTIQNPVLVSALPNGVEIQPASLMTCTVARELARWASEVVAPEAKRHFQTHPTKLLIGTSYQCRAQRSGGKLSEHAYGNGVDIMGFEFNARAPLIVSSRIDSSPEAAFQSAVRAGACPIFSTVLGPGSDEAHSDHLHLDLRERKGNYRICQ